MNKNLAQEKIKNGTKLLIEGMKILELDKKEPELFQELSKTFQILGGK